LTPMSPSERISEIELRLRSSLSPHALEVTDESHLHAGHAGARDGRGHYHVRIACARFKNLSALARHRLIYEALGDLLTTDIHAVRITIDA
jgi:BolA family transcriptional regulator, general stress-responsive regulator